MEEGLSESLRSFRDAVGCVCSKWPRRAASSLKTIEQSEPIFNNEARDKVFPMYL